MSIYFCQVNFMKSVMSGDQLREDRMALDNLLANLPQAKPGKSSIMERVKTLDSD